MRISARAEVAQDRKKRIVSDENIDHCKKIIASLKRTEKLVAEIDTIVSF